MNAWWTRYLPVLIREWLEGRQQLQKTIGNTGWLLFDRILRMGIGLTVGAWVARYLGPSQFGELAYVISFIAFFQIISRLEIDGFIVRDIAQTRGNISVLLGTTLWMKLFSGLCSWIFAVCIMFIFHPKDYQLIILTAIVGSTLIFQASDTIDIWFQSQSQSRRTVIAKFVSYLFSNAIKVILLLIGAPLVAFAGVMSLECAALMVSLVIAYRQFPTNTRWNSSLAQTKYLIKLCWPYVISGLMITTFLRIDQIMLKEMLGERELGIYAAALPLSQIWSVVPATMITSLAPFIAQKRNLNERLYQDMLVLIFRFFAIMALVAALATSIISPWIIKVLYGFQYQKAASILSMHVFVNIFSFQSIAQNLWIVNNNVRKTLLISTSTAAIINVIANFLMISKLGIQGAVFSILITEFATATIPCLLRKDLMHLYSRAFLFSRPTI